MKNTFTHNKQILWEDNNFVSPEEREEKKQRLNRTVDTPIVILDTLYRWDGAALSCNLADTANLNVCLDWRSDAVYAEVFVEDGDLIRRELGQDGENNYIFRQIRPELLDEAIDALETRSFTTCEQFMERYTQSLSHLLAASKAA